MSEIALCKKHGLYMAAGVNSCPICRERRQKDYLHALEVRVAALEAKTSPIDTKGGA